MINANITNQSKVKIVYKGRHSELTDLSKQKLKSDLLKKYPNLKDIIIENKGNNDDIKFLQNLVNKEISKDINTPEFVEQLICEWFKMDNINNVNVEDVIKLNKEIDKETNFKFYENKERKALNIEYIKWDNILSYGDRNEFDFTKLNGITLIKGEPQNQSGKTTFSKHIIEIFLFGGKSQRILSGTINDVFNNNKDIDEAYIEGVFNINNKRYKIERSFFKNKDPKEKINFYLIHEDGKLELLNKDKKGETQEYIETITFPHFTKKDGKEDMFFTDFTLIDRYSVEKIIREGDTYRSKNFRNEIGLCNIIEKEEYVKKKFKEEQKTLECVTHKPFFDNYKKQQEDLEKEKEKIEIEKENIIKNIKNLDKDIIDLENEYIELNNSKLYFDINFDKKLKEKEKIGICNIETIEKKIKRLEEEIKDEKIKIAEKNDIKLNFKKSNLILDNEIEDLKNENISIDNEIKKISKKDNYTKKLFEDAYNNRKNEKTILENKLEEHKIELKSLREKRCCSKCGQIIPNVEEKIKEEEELIAEITENIKNITKKYDNCVSILEKIDKIETNEILIKEKELSIKSNTMQIDIIENLTKITEEVSIPNKLKEINDEKDFIETFNNNTEAIKHNQKIDCQIEIIKTRIEKDIRPQLNAQNKLLGQYEVLEKKNENNIKDLNEIINKIKKSKKIYDIWKKYQESLGTSGISKIVLNRVIGNLNKELSYILRDVCDFDIEIELDDNGDLIFYKTKDGENKISITNAASGFEATISGLALRYLLMKYSKTYKPTFLVLDEINATVAPENQEKLMLLYRRMLEDYSYLMVVTHAETNEDDYDHIIKVTKINGISSISLEK